MLQMVCARLMHKKNTSKDCDRRDNSNNNNNNNNNNNIITVPVVIEALGTIKKDMENYSNKIPTASTYMNFRK